jgi:hypothetical protein
MNNKNESVLVSHEHCLGCGRAMKEHFFYDHFSSCEVIFCGMCNLAKIKFQSGSMGERITNIDFNKIS